MCFLRKMLKLVVNIIMTKKLKVGLALSAGGVRGIYAHSGFLQAFEGMGFQISAISGCSAGAIVGGVYASGTPLKNWLDALDQIHRKNFWEQGTWRQLIWDLLRYKGRTFTGIATTDAPLAFCRQNIAVDSFEACKIPFHSVATSLASGERVMFSEGDLALGIAASAAIPLLYQPVEIDGAYYCDGGVIDLSPTDAICCRYGLDVLFVHHVATRTKGFHGLKAQQGDGWPILEIIDTLMFRNRPWYLSEEPITFQRCPCGCNTLIVVLEPSLPELPWPQTAGGPEIQAKAKTEAEVLLKPWLDTLLRKPSELLNQAKPQQPSSAGGGCNSR